MKKPYFIEVGGCDKCAVYQVGIGNLIDEGITKRAKEQCMSNGCSIYNYNFSHPFFSMDSMMKNVKESPSLTESVIAELIIRKMAFNLFLNVPDIEKRINTLIKGLPSDKQESVKTEIKKIENDPEIKGWRSELQLALK